MIVAITGHRNKKIGGYEIPNPTYIKICQEIENILLELKPEKCISGMALGSDQWFANICFKLNIPLIAAVPFKGQESNWPIKSQQIYHKLLAKASDIVIVSPGEYSVDKMQIRNEWLADRCDILVAVFDGSAGGTKNCVNYAKSKNKQIIFIDPRLDT